MTPNLGNVLISEHSYSELDSASGRESDTGNFKEVKKSAENFCFVNSFAEKFRCGVRDELEQLLPTKDPRELGPPPQVCPECAACWFRDLYGYCQCLCCLGAKACRCDQDQVLPLPLPFNSTGADACCPTLAPASSGAGPATITTCCHCMHGWQ